MPPPPTCRLLAGPAAALSQAALAALVLAALLWKRAREYPRRPIGTWGADVAKQVLGAAAAHSAGLVVALLAAGSGPPSASGGADRAGGAAPSECGWYAVAFALDTGLGTWLGVALHRAAVRAAARAVAGSPAPPPPPLAPAPTPPLAISFTEAVSRCGDYGKPPSASLFIPQALEWVGCVLAARAACGALIAVLHTPLRAVAGGVDAAFARSPPGLELAAVMVAGPLVLNCVQALVNDAVLARRRRVGFTHPPVSPRAGSLTGSSGSGQQALAAAAGAPLGDMEALLTPLPPDRARV